MTRFQTNGKTLFNLYKECAQDYAPRNWKRSINNITIYFVFLLFDQNYWHNYKTENLKNFFFRPNLYNNLPYLEKTYEKKIEVN